MKKHSMIISASFALAFTILTACHKVDEQVVITNDVRQFEAVWNELNDTYVFWSVDTTDWDAVYSKYHPLFEEMENESNSMWTVTWRELTSTLLDHHLTINLKRPSTSYQIELKPGSDEVVKRNYVHNTFSSSVHKEMLDVMVSSGHLLDTVTDSFRMDGADIIGVLYSGILDQEIAYIYISSFRDPLRSKTALKHFKQLVANKDIKAAIIDVRDNRGGRADNLVPVLSCFTTKQVLIGYSCTKLGIGKYDLSPKAQTIITPSSDSQEREIPIIVLTNISSMSMAEITTVALRCLPHCYVVGERTFGATGSSTDYLVEKEGNGYFIKTAQILFEGVDGTIYEGHGVKPDIECLFKQSLWNSGIDNQLEMAISVAKDKIAENANQ